MRLNKQSQELDSADLLRLMEEADQPDQSPEMFNAPKASMENGGPDAAGELDDMPLDQAAEESWEDGGPGSELDDGPPPG